MNKRIISTQLLLYFFMLMFLMITVSCSSSDSPPAKKKPPTETYTYTVTFDSQKATAEANPTSVKVTSPATTVGTLPTAPTRSGYIFGGWYTGPAGYGKWFTASSTVTTDITVYASWLSYSYTVTYDTQMAETDLLKVKVISPATTVGTLPKAPNRIGYTFAGWWTGIDGTGTAFTASTTVTADITVYAYWIENTKGIALKRTATAYTQADLAGTWNVHMLKAGTNSKWSRARLTFNASGVLAGAADCLDSGGASTCPTNVTWTIDSNTGVITVSGTDAGNETHMTMASNKNFIAGTDGATGGDSAELIIAQKEVMGTTYSAADLQNKSAVYHELWVGSGYNEWSYGVVTTDATGTLNVASETTPSGTSVLETKGTLSVDSNGFVYDSEVPSYEGFLSADKKTMVATKSNIGSSSYALMIINFTDGQTCNAGFVPAGTAFHHLLGCGTAVGWIHFTKTVNSSGVFTYSDWVSSNTAWTAPTETHTGYIDASGTVTIDGNITYHGQVSNDGTFVVGTLTRGTSPNFVYFLNVSTK